jgi:hypothetical protein
VSSSAALAGPGRYADLQAAPLHATIAFDSSARWRKPCRDARPDGGAAAHLRGLSDEALTSSTKRVRRSFCRL